MVVFFKALLLPLLLATYAAAEDLFKIINPNSEVWWVAGSQNVMIWDCDNPQAQQVNNFSVLFQVPGNSPGAVIGVQKNEACSISLTQQQINATAGKGYLLYLANDMNISDIYATSQPFEIKPLGSVYPSTSAFPSSTSNTGEASSTASSNSSSNAASLGSHSSSFLGLTGIMGLLTVGLLGA